MRSITNKYTYRPTQRIRSSLKSGKDGNLQSSQMVLPDFYNTGNTAAAELAFFKLSGGENASKKKISISTTSIGTYAYWS